MRKPFFIVALIVLFSLAGGGTAWAQLQTVDILLQTTSGITHIRAGVSVPVVPVPGDGNAFPTSWGNAAISWVTGTQYVVAGQGVPPYGVFLMDFTNSVNAPTSYRLGLAAAAVKDIDMVDSTGDLLFMESTPTGGQIIRIAAPVGTASTFDPIPWATALPIGNTDFMTSVSATSCIVGGVANTYFVAQGAVGGTAAPYAAGNLLYSCKAVESDSITGYLYSAVYNPHYVRQHQSLGGTTYADLGNILQAPEITNPEDVDFDETTQTLYCACRASVVLPPNPPGIPWGVQTGNDNAIIAINVTLPPGTGYTSVGPVNGHGNSGFFVNITVVGSLSQFPASVVSNGTGCVGASGFPFTMGNIGLPRLNNSMTLTMSNGQPNSVGFIYLAVGFSPTPIPISPVCNLYMDLTTTLLFIQTGFGPFGPLPLDNTGATGFPVFIPNQTTLLGAFINCQGVAADTTAPSSFVSSNALQLNFGL